MYVYIYICLFMKYNDTYVYVYTHLHIHVNMYMSDSVFVFDLYMHIYIYTYDGHVLSSFRVAHFFSRMRFSLAMPSQELKRGLKEMGASAGLCYAKGPYTEHLRTQVPKNYTWYGVWNESP